MRTQRGGHGRTRQAGLLQVEGVEAAMGLLTAEEAVELSGFEGELLLIDGEMRAQADKSSRCMFLRLGRIPKSQMPHIIESLQSRGFIVEKQNNPGRVEVTW